MKIKVLEIQLNLIFVVYPLQSDSSQKLKLPHKS